MQNTPLVAASRMFVLSRAVGVPTWRETVVAIITEIGILGRTRVFFAHTGIHPGQVRGFRSSRYSAACRTWRALRVRMVTSSSAAVGCRAIVASKSALVAFILTAMPSTCTISAAPSPTI
jgi:hypothetical protein